MDKEKEFKGESDNNFMRKKDRKLLYSIIGFIGGLIFMSNIVAQNAPFKVGFIIGGGLFTAWVGYKIATR